MAYDYSRAVALAHKMIYKFGRSITLRQFDDAGADSVNPPVKAAVNAMAAFVEPSSLTRLGMRAVARDLFKDCSEIALVAPPMTGDDLRNFHVIDDDAKTSKIVVVDLFKPGDTAVLYFVGVKA